MIGEEQPESGLAIHLLGGFSVLRDGLPVAFDGGSRRKTETLLKVLLTRRGQVFSLEQLVEHLYPAAFHDHAARNLSSRLSDLRSALEPNLQSGRESTYVLRVGKGSYCFSATAPCWVDTEAFQRCHEQGRRYAEAGLWIQAVQQYRQALTFGRGDFASEDPYAEWASASREQWRTLRIDVLEGLSNCHLRLGQYRAAVDCCQQVISAEPYLERVYRQKIRCHVAAGDHGLAIQTLAACRDALKELGVEPAPETMAIYREISEGRPRPLAVASQPEQRPVVMVYDGAMQSSALPLQGRTAELAGIQQALDRAAVNQGRVVLLNGPAGIGKTRLVDEVVSLAPKTDCSPTRWGAVLVSRCRRLTPQLPCAPFVELISGLLTPENLDLLPVSRSRLSELGKWGARMASSPNDELQDYYPFLQGVFELVSHLPHPCLMVIEDLHLADSWTRQILANLVYHRSARGIAVLVTLRPDEAAEELGQELHAWQRDGLVSDHSLQPLSREATQKVAAVMTGAGNQRLGEKLWALSHGNPFYAVEFLRTLQATGKLTPAGLDTAGRMPVPDGIQAMVRSRLSCLPPQAGELVRAAAIFPRAFPFRALEAVSGLGPAEAVSALEVLLQAGLLLEGPGGKIKFADPIVQRAARHDLSEVRRHALDERLTCTGNESRGADCDDCLRLVSGLACCSGKMPRSRRPLQYGRP